MPRLAVPHLAPSLALGAARSLGTVREMAQIGAALGRSFSHELIAQRRRGRAAAAGGRGLAQLVGAELVFQRGTPAMQSTPSSTRWCRTQPIAPCCAVDGQQIHARIATTLESCSLKSWPLSRNLWPTIVPRPVSTKRRSLPAQVRSAGGRAVGGRGSGVPQLQRGLELLANMPRRSAGPCSTSSTWWPWMRRRVVADTLVSAAGASLSGNRLDRLAPLLYLPMGFPFSGRARAGGVPLPSRWRNWARQEKIKPLCCWVTISMRFASSRGVTARPSWSCVMA